MKNHIVLDAGGLVAINDRYTDIGVHRASGYRIYKLDEEFGGVKVADKLSHLIGKRIVLEPKKDSQITEADFLAAVEKAA